ncbi:MAG: TlpA disulfide reductase family protein [Bacteroidota bacterium]|nr:TlpA disulfide reductase family protein [Bacteroidota bacterium]
MKYGLIFFLLLYINICTAQKTGEYRGTLLRADGNHIGFDFDMVTKSGKTVWYIINGEEKILVDDIIVKGDSMFVNMPIYESQFKIKINDSTNLQGAWGKATRGKTMLMPFVANKRGVYTSYDPRLLLNQGITGTWKVDFTDVENIKTPAVGVFAQYGFYITGTFLTPTGDYRFLSGVVDNEKIYLYSFDGARALFFYGRIKDTNTIIDGHFYSGDTYKETWVAIRDSNATPHPELSAAFVKPNSGPLNFSFKNTDGISVSIKDKHYKNRVVIIQILGSWCPNCIDETAFLTEYYNANKSRGVEVIGLAYEYSADMGRCMKNLRKLKLRLNVPYELLITGVAVGDTMRTEKTLPQITKIKMFPTTIIVDKKGNIRKIDTGFYGPGTGEYYEKYKMEFAELMDSLLGE